MVGIGRPKRPLAQWKSSGYASASGPAVSNKGHILLGIRIAVGGSFDYFCAAARR